MKFTLFCIKYPIFFTQFKVLMQTSFRSNIRLWTLRIGWGNFIEWEEIFFSSPYSPSFFTLYSPSFFTLYYSWSVLSREEACWHRLGALKGQSLCCSEKSDKKAILLGVPARVIPSKKCILWWEYIDLFHATEERERSHLGQIPIRLVQRERYEIRARQWR